MASVCVLRAHVVDESMLELFREMRDDLGADRVFVLFDDTRGGWPRDAVPPELAGCTLVVTDEECIAANTMHDKGYGHDAASWSFWHPETSFVMMHDWLREKMDAVDLVWFVEYDVRCNGSFEHVLARCDAVPADFMACGGGEGQTTLRTGREDPNWCWWPRLDGDIDARVAPADRVGAFFPMVRVSRALVEAIRAQFGRSTGFCEVYVPTLASTTPGLVAAAFPPGSLGQFRYRPMIEPDTWRAFQADTKHRMTPEDARLYHPIKR